MEIQIVDTVLQIVSSTTNELNASVVYSTNPTSKVQIASKDNWLEVCHRTCNDLLTLRRFKEKGWPGSMYGISKL